VGIAGVANITEAAGGRQLIPSAQRSAATFEAAPTPVLVGEMEIVVNVLIEYEIA
jgi:uncharacterized protein YggE